MSSKVLPEKENVEKGSKIKKKDKIEREERKEWSRCLSKDILVSLCPILVKAKGKEIKQIIDFILNKESKNLYMYGSPGSGKTHTAKAIGDAFVQKGLEVYYTNLNMDKSFTKIGRNCTKCVLLIIDEFEGNKKTRLYIRQKDKLTKIFIANRTNESIFYKVMFISNEKCKEGIRFKPYSKESIIDIVSINSNKKDLKSIKEKSMCIKEGVEKADIRVSLQKKIRYQKKELDLTDPTDGQYHQFIQKKIKNEEVNINLWYVEFIAEMKQKKIPLISKELFKDITDAYINGHN